MKKGDARALIFFVGVIIFIVSKWIVPENPELTIVTFGLGLFFGFFIMWYHDKRCPQCDRVGEWNLIRTEDLGGWTEKKAVPYQESDGTVFYREEIYVGSKVRKTWKCRNCGYTRHKIHTHIDKY